MADTTTAPRGRAAAARPPANAAAAAALLERFALVDGQLASIEERRKVELGQVNAAIDSEAGPLIAELQALSQRLQPWWNRAGTELAKGRKSVQLGGCVIGYRTARAKLEHGFATDEAAVEALRKTRLGSQTTRVKYSLDRTATTRLIRSGGKTAATLGQLGFKIDQAETFFVERVEQPGTVTAS
jgi:hypothetical protein